MHWTDLLLSAAPVESHVGAIVVSALVLVEATPVPVCTQERVGLSQRLRNVGLAPWHFRRCKSAQSHFSLALNRSRMIIAGYPPQSHGSGTALQEPGGLRPPQ